MGIEFPTVTLLVLLQTANAALFRSQILNQVLL